MQEFGRDSLRPGGLVLLPAGLSLVISMLTIVGWLFGIPILEIKPITPVAIFAIFNIVSIGGVTVGCLTLLRQREIADEQRQMRLQSASAIQQSISSSDVDLTSLIDVVLESAKFLVRADAGAVLDFDGESPRWIGSTSAKILRDLHLVQEAIGKRTITSSGGTLAIPLASDRAIEQVLVLNRNSPHFTGEEIDLLSLALGTAGTALQRARDLAVRAERVARLETRFAAFMEGIPAAAYVKDERGRYVYANRMVAKFLGHDLERILEATDDSLLPEYIAQRRKDEEAALLESKATRHDIERIGSGEDASSWLLLRFPIVERESLSIGGIAVDITELERARERPQ